MAWSSLAGFQSGSNITSRLAPIKFRPHPPALLLSIKMNSGLYKGGGGETERERVNERERESTEAELLCLAG